MRTLLLLPVVALTLSMQAQAPASSSSKVSVSASVRIAAEFTKRVTTKDAKVGDEVAARTTANAILADGTELPKGTRILGTVTEVRAKTNEQKTSHLAFRFDRAILRDGHEISLQTVLTSLAAPGSPASGSMTGQASTDPMFSGENGAGSRSSGRGSSSGSSSGSGGGLLGGGSRSTTAGAGGLPGKAIDPAGADATTQVRPVASPEGSLAGGNVANGNYVIEALAVHYYPVANMPGVILSSQVNTRNSAMVDASAQNIDIGSGCQMTMNAAVVLH